MKQILLLLLLAIPLFAQTPPPCGSLPPLQRGAKKVTINPSTGDGTITSPYTGWEDQVNAAPESAKIYLPGGIYGRKKTIYPKRGQVIEGDGQDATLIISLPGANPIAIYSLWPSNCSTYVKLVIHSLAIEGNGQPNQQFGFRDNGGTYLELYDLLIRGYDYCMAFDQTEIFDVHHSHFESYNKAGVWYVNGDDLVPGNSAGYVNAHSIHHCAFNSSGIAIINDGGNGWACTNNAFNGGHHQIFVAGVQSGSIRDNYMEGSDSDGIFTWYQSYKQYITGSPNAVGGNYNLEISNNIITTAGGYAIANNYYSLSINGFLGGKEGGMGRGCNGWAPPSIQLGNLGYGNKPVQTCPDIAPVLRFNLNDPSNNTATQISQFVKTANFDYLTPGTCQEIEYKDLQNLKLTSFVIPSVDYTTASGSLTHVRDNTSFFAYVKNATTIVVRRCNINGKAPASKITNAAITLWVK